MEVVELDQTVNDIDTVINSEHDNIINNTVNNSNNKDDISNKSNKGDNDSNAKERVRSEREKTIVSRLMLGLTNSNIDDEDTNLDNEG